MVLVFSTFCFFKPLYKRISEESYWQFGCIDIHLFDLVHSAKFFTKDAADCFVKKSFATLFIPSYLLPFITCSVLTKWVNMVDRGKCQNNWLFARAHAKLIDFGWEENVYMALRSVRYMSSFATCSEDTSECSIRKFQRTNNVWAKTVVKIWLLLSMYSHRKRNQE